MRKYIFFLSVILMGACQSPAVFVLGVVFHYALRWYVRLCGHDHCSAAFCSYLLTHFDLYQSPIEKTETDREDKRVRITGANRR